MWIDIPSITFLILWSPTICNSLAALSAAFCFLDVGILVYSYWYHRRVSTTTPFHQKCHFDYQFILRNSLYHFLDAKMFHSVRRLRELHMLLPIYILGRIADVCSLAEVSDPGKSRTCLPLSKTKYDMRQKTGNHTCA